MAGFNPLAAAGLAPSALAAIDLGISIEILQSQLTVGDLLTATILPPQGGADRLQLLGQTVLAQLPPGIDPGETLLLQVTAFADNQIVVRNLGTVDPQNPPPTVQIELPVPQDGAAVAATLTTILSKDLPPPVEPPAGQPSTGSQASIPAAEPEAAAAPNQPAGSAPVPLAPPRAVFVAASVQRPGSAPAAPSPVAQSAAKSPFSGAAFVAERTDELSLEARIAAARAIALDSSDSIAAPARNSIRPPVAGAQAAPVPADSAASPPVAAIRAPAAAVRAPAAPEAALLARLRVPATPLTLAAARLAGSAATALPRALARLDAALTGVAAEDPRAASLRALAAFVTKLDPGNARALPEQLMAFVNNAVAGPESKIVAILRLLVPEPVPDAEEMPAPQTATAPPPAPVPQTASAPQAQSPASPVPLTPSAPAAAPASQPAPAAQVAERLTALSADLKATIVALAEAPPRDAPPELASALNDALTAVTALQINVLGAQNSDPSAITIPLPVFFHENGRPAQLRISRESARGKQLDADNFHIAFVLDTRSLGTVAVDLQTVGRAVSVSVKTEASPAAGRFRSTLDDLRGRLERMRFRVAAMAASVAPHRVKNEPAPPPLPALSLDRANSRLDTRA